MDNLSLKKNKHIFHCKNHAQIFFVGFWYLNDLLVSFFLSLFSGLNRLWWSLYLLSQRWPLHKPQPARETKRQERLVSSKTRPRFVAAVSVLCCAVPSLFILSIHPQCIAIQFCDHSSHFVEKSMDLHI